MALKPNYYETLYVVRPDLKEDELGKIQSKLPEFIAAHEGEIMKSDKWAERELAYEIQDHKRGTYYILIFKALPTVTKDIEKHLRFYNTDVLRFMTVRIDEEVAVREKNAAAQSSAAEQSAPETPPAEQAQAQEAPAEPPQAEEQAPEVVEPAATEPQTPQETPAQESAVQSETQEQEAPTEAAESQEAETQAQSEPESEEEGGKE